MSKVIAVDFDGVIHEYSHGWQKGAIYDPPIKGSLRALKKLMDKGYDIVVFTARENLDDVRAWLIEEWTKEFSSNPNVTIDPKIEVTNIKPKATAYIDDRAIRFTNWKDMLNYFP